MTSFAEMAYSALEVRRTNGPLKKSEWLETVQSVFDGWKPKSSHLTVTSDCHRIYALFPRHIGKEAALKAIAKAINKAGVEKLVIAVNRYKFCTDRWKKEDRQYIPHPATWFNEGRYDDDQAEWDKGGKPAGKAKPSVYEEPQDGWQDVALQLWPDAGINLLAWRDVSHTCKTEIHSKIYP